eukprot:10251083-Ditylum_brightwellii.AAC.2
METTSLFLAQESREFASCKFCHWTVLHMGKILLHNLDQSIPEWKGIPHFFLIQIEERIWDFYPQRLKLV